MTAWRHWRCCGVWRAWRAWHAWRVWRAWLAAVLTCAVALALAAGARYWLIEPAGVSARCDAGAADGWCLVRAWTIQLFVHQRIGWLALGLGLIAYLTRWRSVACVGLFAACAGLVLYTAGLCAPAALLALLALVRKPKTIDPASTINSRQKASA